MYVFSEEDTLSLLAHKPLVRKVLDPARLFVQTLLTPPARFSQLNRTELQQILSDESSNFLARFPSRQQ